MRYSQNRKGYKYYHIPSSCMYISRHVVFDIHLCPFSNSCSHCLKDMSNSFIFSLLEISAPRQTFGRTYTFPVSPFLNLQVCPLFPHSLCMSSLFFTWPHYVNSYWSYHQFSIWSTTHRIEPRATTPQISLKPTPY